MDIFNNFSDLLDQVKNLYFSIPSDLFNAIYGLTNFVGYILPLRLYTPIFVLIFNHWFLMIAINAGRSIFSFISSFGSLIFKLGKK